MAFEGALKDLPLPDVIQLIFLQKKTGVLTIFRAKEVVTLSFDKGMIVFADEFQRSEQERLGAVLLKARLITPQQLLKAVEMQKQTLQKLGHILVANGFLSQDQLKRALQMQVRETAYKLFRWEDGQFKFTQEPVAFDTTLYVPMASDYLVMEGIRRIDEWPVIRKKVPGPDIIYDRAEAAEEKISEAGGADMEQDLDSILSLVEEPALSGAPKEGGGGFKLSPGERVVFSLVDGRRTVDDLVDECRIGEFETYKALFSLVSLGLIAKTGEKAAAAEKERGVAKRGALKRLLTGLAAAAAIAVITLVNPLGLVRIWPAGQSTREQVGQVGDGLRRDRIRFALRCYQLEEKNYPATLAELVSGGFLEPEEILDHRGEEFSYLREQNGYSLRVISGWSRR